MDDLKLPPRQIAEIPPDLLKTTDIPKELKRALANTEQTTPCGMPYSLTWTTGPSQGMPVTGWCAEPLCIRPGEEPGPCTGPRFVPHINQYTRSDPTDPLRRQRALTAGEIIGAVRKFGEKATSITGVRDDRSAKEIGVFVVEVWRRMKNAIENGGGWSPG
jgi:hypothetical protein